MGLGTEAQVLERTLLKRHKPTLNLTGLDKPQNITAHAKKPSIKSKNTQNSFSAITD